MSRPVRVVIPFKFQGAKSRLAPFLFPEERQSLALCMLKDVLNATSWVGKVTILSKPRLNNNLPLGLEVLESDQELNDALNSLIEEWQSQGWPEDLLIVMADLALLTKDDVEGIIRQEGDVVLSPGRGGGTNMILIRSPEFRTCYQGHSFPKHLELAMKLGLKAGIFASYRAGCDIDDPSDLPEILIHGKEESTRFLRSLGFALSEECRGGCVRKEPTSS